MSRKQKIGKNINTQYSHETASLGTGTNKNFALQERADQMFGFNIKIADSTAYQNGYGATMGINSAGTFIFKNTSSSVVSGEVATLNQVFSISKTGVLTASSLNVGATTFTGNLDMGGFNITNGGTISGTLSTASQTNITSVGTLTGLTMGGTLNMAGNSITNLTFGAITMGGNLNMAGYRILNASTSDFNTCYGTNAGNALTTGQNNTGFGYNSIKMIIGHYDNTAFGYSTLANSVEGYQNTVVGSEAGAAMLSGYGNTAVGRQALNNCTNGYQNICIGSAAGSTITTGRNNIIIGVGADVSNNNNEGQILIGYGVYSGTNNICKIFSFVANQGCFINSLVAGSTTQYVVSYNPTTWELNYTTNDGWISAAAETWAYVSADAPTFVFSVNADVTTKYSVGMKIRYVQSATTKYGIITAVGSYSGGVTNITIYGGGGDAGTYTNATSYTLANAAISSNFYSMIKTPYGFPMSPTTWSYIMTNSLDYSTSSSTFVSAGAGLQSNCPIGLWQVNCSYAFQQNHGSVQDCWADSALSTSTSSVSHPELLAAIQGVRLTNFDFRDSVYLSTFITVAAKTIFYYIFRTYSGRTGIYKGTLRATYAKFVCAYL